MVVALWVLFALVLTWVTVAGCAKPKKETVKESKPAPPPPLPPQPKSAPAPVSRVPTGPSCEELKSASNLNDAAAKKLTKSQLLELAKEIGIAQSQMQANPEKTHPEKTQEKTTSKRKEEEKTDKDTQKSGGKASPAKDNKKSKKDTTEGKSKPEKSKK